MSFKPIDPKRDKFRKYLEQTRVMEVLHKAIVELYMVQDQNPKPENALEFIRTNLGDALLEKDTIQYLQNELEESRSTEAKLRKQIKALNLALNKLEPSTSPMKQTNTNPFENDDSDSE